MCSYITQHAGSISKLDISTCSRITDAGIAQLGAPDSPSLQNLVALNVSGCPHLTNISLDHLRRCRNLKTLDIRNIPQITLSGLTKYHSQTQVFPRSRVTVKSDFNSKSVNVGASTSGGAGTSSHPSLFPGTSGSVGAGPSTSGQGYGYGKTILNPKS